MVMTRAEFRKELDVVVYEYALDDRIWSTGSSEHVILWKIQNYTKDLLATKN
jgi:hypothetical protein